MEPAVDPRGSAVDNSERSLDLAIAYVITLLLKDKLATTQVALADVTQMATNAKSAVFTDLYKKDVEPKEMEFRLFMERAKLGAKKSLGKYYARMHSFEMKSETVCTFGKKEKKVSSVAPLIALKYVLEFVPILHESNSIVDQAEELLKNVQTVFAAFN